LSGGSSFSEEQFFETIEIISGPFALFWYDTLNLTNGICFLKLFASMAKRDKKKRRAIVKNTTDCDISLKKDGAVLDKKGIKKPFKKRRLLEEDNKDHKSDNQKSWGTNSV
jgi:hypothetical protein